MMVARERAIRGHIRNYLVGLSESEVQLVLLDAIGKGDTARIKYTNEWLEELVAENAACSG